jgi:nitronate monooxygenase
MPPFTQPETKAHPVSGTLPVVIQGGMGIGVSGWSLANAVARRGQLGVVSGTALDTVTARRLQEGDVDGALRRAMACFPIPDVADEALARYFRPRGLPPRARYRLLPLGGERPDATRERFAMLSAFAEIHLAREGHHGPVGINLLTKVQSLNLPSLYGAMLAGVDYVLMGAGIPKDIPAVLDLLSEHRTAALRFDIEDLPDGRAEFLEFDPRPLWAGTPAPLHRPRFLPIVASHSLAIMLARKASARVDGFVVEGPTAGGHNAPPRGDAALNQHGEPIYGPRDEVDLARMRELGLPFWLAGGAGRAGGLAAAQREGAAGIQVGTLFAYCDESGLSEEIKRAVLAAAARNEVSVLTDPRASPTGYPFKRVHGVTGAAASSDRERLCDLGYLRAAYVRPDGKIGHRCPSEPVAAFVRKGGRAEDTIGRVCLCNGLIAAVGHAQVRVGGGSEPPLLTSGDDLVRLGAFLNGRTRYRADDVIDFLLGTSATAPLAGQDDAR